MLKLRLCFRVMIWQPFAFYILPFSVNPSKSPFHPPIRKLLILKLASSFFFFMKIRTTLHIFFGLEYENQVFLHKSWKFGIKALSYSRWDYSRWDRYLGMTAAMTQVPVPTAKMSPRLKAIHISSELTSLRSLPFIIIKPQFPQYSDL